MWKRERQERVDLEHVMSQPSTPAAPATPAVRPVAPPPAPAAEVPVQRTAAAQPPAKGSTLGSTLVFKGELIADEDLVIQGQVEGSVLHTRSLTIGAQGRMRGDIRARRIVVEGAVDGDLYALESVTMRSGAAIRGDVFAPKVAIDEGARLSGRIDMDKAPTVPTVSARLPGATEQAATELSEQETSELLSRA